MLLLQQKNENRQETDMHSFPMAMSSGFSEERMFAGVSLAHDTPVYLFKKTINNLKQL
jgi:hypothetical protein